MWNPSYLSVAGLQGLIASGVGGKPEAFLINNNTKPPVNDQFSAGFRQSFGNIATSISYAGIRGRNGFTFVFGNRNPDGSCCINPIAPDFSNLLLSSANKRFWYDALYVTADKAYTTQSNWGAGLAYTHAKATQTGNDLFSLDYPSAAAYPRHEVPGSERDRIVMTGMYGLPYDVMFSSILSFGTGGATNVLDFSQGFGLSDRLKTQPFRDSIRPPKTWGFADRDIDFRLSKDFRVFGNASVGLIAEVFNAFNFHNYGCLANFIPPEGNPSFGPALSRFGLQLSLARSWARRGDRIEGEAND